MSENAKFILIMIALFAVFRALIAIAGIKIGILEAGLVGAVAGGIAKWLVTPAAE